MTQKSYPVSSIFQKKTDMALFHREDSHLNVHPASHNGWASGIFRLKFEELLQQFG